MTLVGAKAHSGKPDQAAVLTSIGAKKHVFSGTFTGRSAIGGLDFVLGVYTEKEGGLHMNVLATDTDRPMTLDRIDKVTWTITFNGSTLLGSFHYNVDSGEFSITSKNHWFQGELMGSYMRVK